MARAPLGAALAEEADQARDVCDVDEAVRRIGGDVVAGGGGRDGGAEVVRQEDDVGDVGEGVVVDVGGPGVGAAGVQRVGADDHLGAVAPAVVVGVLDDVDPSAHLGWVDGALVIEGAGAIELVHKGAGRLCGRPISQQELRACRSGLGRETTVAVRVTFVVVESQFRMAQRRVL